MYLDGSRALSCFQLGVSNRVPATIHHSTYPEHYHWGLLSAVLFPSDRSVAPGVPTDFIVCVVEPHAPEDVWRTFAGDTLPGAWLAHVKSQQQRIEHIQLCYFVSYNAAYVARPMRLQCDAVGARRTGHASTITRRRGRRLLDLPAKRAHMNLRVLFPSAAYIYASSTMCFVPRPLPPRRRRFRHAACSRHP